ncbi:MAG: hypothetical protein CSA52_02835 [Gammaproteobacteria bacterium]|nr:MAG: hypothetical protein CSB48_04505 [Pseudomonadota bacterium]PIE38335.1 MAG: hypothetical protein CSA52_02835 [Gammaproteobacteria bacterium]
MKAKQKVTSFVTAAAFCLLGTSALAHQLWVIGKNDGVLKADTLYGHNFPVLEEIDESRLVLFEPVQVYGENYHEVLTQKGPNYHFETRKALPNGTYILENYYKPTAWSEKADGKWEMGKTRKDIDGEVKSCGIYDMHGKAIVTIGDDDGTFAMKPLGKHLEITPMVKAGDILVDNLVKFKITRDGKPVKLAEITGFYEGYSDNAGMSAPFYAKSDLKGEFQFRPLRAGSWYLYSIVETEGTADCEVRQEEASLIFDVKDK